MMNLMCVLEKSLEFLAKQDTVALGNVLTGLNEIPDGDNSEVEDRILSVVRDCPLIRDRFLPTVPSFGTRQFADPSDESKTPAQVFEELNLVRNKFKTLMQNTEEEIAYERIQAPLDSQANSKREDS